MDPEDPPPRPPSAVEATGRKRPDWWGPFDSERSLLALERVFEDDPGGQELEGVGLGLAFWGDSYSDSSGRGMYSLTYASGEGQRVIRADVNTGIMMFAVGPLRALPTLGLGVEYRGSNPDDGFAGLFSIGLETALWLPRRWQVVASLQRHFGFPSGTRNELGLALRYSPVKLSRPTKPLLPPHEAVDP